MENGELKIENDQPASAGFSFIVLHGSGPTKAPLLTEEWWHPDVFCRDDGVVLC
jgi:hypothetical protein